MVTLFPFIPFYVFLQLPLFTGELIPTKVSSESEKCRFFFALGTQMIICIYPPSLVYSIPHFEHTKGFYLKGHFIGYVLLLFISSWNALMSLVLYTYRIIILIRYAHLQYSIFNSIFNKNSF